MQDARRTPFDMHVGLPERLEFSGEFGAEINSFRSLYLLAASVRPDGWPADPYL